MRPLSCAIALLLSSSNYYSTHAFSFVPSTTTSVTSNNGAAAPFVVVSTSTTTSSSSSSLSKSSTLLFAGGFEWEDPEEAFDQGVDNPFKNENVEEDDGMKVDPARLLGPRLQGCNLYFIGMMGSGKTAVGEIVAKRMGTYNFLDTDKIVETATGISIPEIFAAEGEDAFRTIEGQVLDSVHAHVRCVVSTGGGIVCRPMNWSKLQSGMVIFLDVEPSTIFKRIKGDTNRPLLQTDDPLQTLTDLLEERMGKYNQADVKVTVTKDMDASATADLVIKELHDFIDNNPPAWKQAKAKAQEEGLDWVK